MGKLHFYASYVAVRGKDPPAVLKELGLRGTGANTEQRKSLQVPADSQLLGANLPNGWYLAFANSLRFAVVKSLAKLSKQSEVIQCCTDTRCMMSRAESWKNGRLVWNIAHDSELGIDDLETKGELPSVFDSIHERLKAEQTERDEVDYMFEVPVEVARAITGFPNNEIQFEKREKRKWWQFW